MLPVFEKMLGMAPPAWVRKVEVAVILGVFAEAFDVDPPALEDRPANECLYVFREFTAACMEEALKGGKAAISYRDRLGSSGFRLGLRIREMLNVSAASAFPFAQFLYRGIGIELAREDSGCLKFESCSFAQRYSPECCLFMSAFDEGFLCGLLEVDARLVFSCRLTEGAPCCRACYE